MQKKNTAELWDGVWAQPSAVEKDLYAVAKEERLIRWQRMEAMVDSRFGGFDGLSVVEVGAGRGTNAALMARRGARVTVLDYSDGALERSRRLFDALGLAVEHVCADALDLPESLHGRYDLAMSFGLAEHFLGAHRKGILKAHFDLLTDRGLAFISVPNAHNPPYRLYKWITERTGRWGVGEEYPFSRAEFELYCAELGVDEYGFFGDSLLRSKRFLNPFKWLPRRKRKPRAEPPAAAATGPAAANAPGDELGANPADGPAHGNPHGAARRPYRRRLPRRERGTPLDAHWSYALVLWGAKPKSRAEAARIEAVQAAAQP
jgi:SAM-dependent methyltransferase